MFFKKEKHPLPKFPPKVIPYFRSYCRAVPIEDLPAIRDAIMASFEMDYNTDDPDRDLLDQMKRACNCLLDVYEKVGNREKALIIGALRYRVSVQDGIDDHAFAAGYLDDVKVLNHVLEKLGISNFFVRFDSRHTLR